MNYQHFESRNMWSLSMIKQHSDRVDLCLENLCAAGCQSVRIYIDHLEKGETVEGVENLTQRERLEVLQELKAVMAVYEEDCT